MPGWDGEPGQLHPSPCPRDVGAAVLPLGPSWCPKGLPGAALGAFAMQVAAAASSRRPPASPAARQQLRAAGKAGFGPADFALGWINVGQGLLPRTAPCQGLLCWWQSWGLLLEVSGGGWGGEGGSAWLGRG